MKKFTLNTPKPKWLLWLTIVLFMPFLAMAQNGAIVTGTIVNEGGEPLQGVTVKATSQDQKDNFTTATNENGVFVFRQLTVGGVYTFTTSYVEYEQNSVRSFTVKQGNNSILIKLQPSNNSLSQVVVIG